MSFRSVIVLLLPLTAALWPLPSSYTNGSQVLWINNGIEITYSSSTTGVLIFTDTSPETSFSGKLTSTHVVNTAIKRMKKTIFNQNFVPWRFHTRNSDFEPSLGPGATYIKSISLIQTETDPIGLSSPLDGQLNESYALDVTTAGVVTVKAPSSLGIAYGLTTFTQMFYLHSTGAIYTNVAPVQIVDSPKFPHRGLNMDVSRSFYPVAAIERTIDALAYNKMNRLHLHITDSQSWPLVIASIPDLATKGAYSPSLTYSPADVRKIQQYGAQIGVEVYLEIDMPGHIGSVSYAYPDLIAASNVQPDWDSYSAEPPSGQFKLNSTAVYTFLTSLWNDLLPRVSAYTSYFHTGGDEFNFNVYKLDNTVNSSDPAVIQPLLQKFIDTAHARIRKSSLIPMVWEEMLLNYGISLGSDVIVQTWLGDASVLAVVQTGRKALAGSYNFWYLDCGQGQWVDSTPGVVAQSSYPYTDWCSPRKSWRLVYSHDPLSSVPSSLEHLVLGGEAHIWSEQTDPQNVDRMLWPRLSAVAEVLWSGAKDAQGQNRSQVTASPRLAEMRERLVARGVAAEPVQMPFCTQGDEQCVLWD